MKVGVIGLGTMGMGAALNLARKGHTVVGCEVARSRPGGRSADGRSARAGELPAELKLSWCSWSTRRRPRMCCSASDGCLARLAKGAVVLCCSTIAPEAARALGAKITGARAS